MKVLLQSLGLLVAGVMLVVSAGMNWRFGFQLGTTELDGHIFGGASVASDCFKALLPFFVAYAWRERRWVSAVSGVAVWLVFTAYSMTSAIGFSSLNRVEGTGTRSQEATRVKDARADKVRIEARLAQLQHRPLEVIETELQTLLNKQYRWSGRYQSLDALTQGCTRVVGSKTRTACEHVGALRIEVASAREEKRLRGQLAQAVAILDGASGVATQGDTDTQVQMFHILSGLSQDTVRNVLIVGIAIVVEIGSSLGIYLSLGVKRERTEEDELVLAQRYVKERLVKDADATVQSSELHADYSQWVERMSTTPPMNQTAFGRWFGEQFDKERMNGRYHYKGIRLA